MSDSSQWQSPGGSTPTPPQSEQNPFASPGPPPSGFGPQQHQPGFIPPPQQQPGWTPPPKPGLIPLRPLTLGNILGASFQVMRRNPRPTFGLSLLIMGAVTLLTTAAVGLVMLFAFDRTLRASTVEDSEVIASGAIAIGILSFIAVVVVSVIGGAILQGIITLEVARGTVGEKLRLKGLWRLARGRIGALVGWSFLIGAALFIGVLALILVIALLAAVAGPVGAIVGIFVYLFGLLAMVVLMCWLGTRLAFVPSALVLERLPLIAAARRSWSITRGYFWRTFGILILVWFILNVAIQIVTTPLSFALGIVASLMNPNGDIDAATGWLIAISALTLVVTLLLSAVTAIVTSATAALLYIDLRMRKEGLDLELSRFVEARQAGDAAAADPYLPRGAPGHYYQPAAAPSSSPWA